MRAIGILLAALGALSASGELNHLAIPTARWFFETSRQVPWLHADTAGGGVFPWFGWCCALLLLASGLTMAARSFSRAAPDPLTLQRMRRFREITRGHWSLVILITLGAVAALDKVVVGKRALAVQLDGNWRFPAFLPQDLRNRDFGITTGPADAPVDYRRLEKTLRENGRGRVIMPPVPYDPTGDTLAPRSRPLVLREGVYHQQGGQKPFFGLAARFHDTDTGRIHIRHTLRNGVLSGPADGWSADGTPVYSAEYLNGKPVNERFTGTGTMEDFLGLPTGGLRALKYHPAPPLPAEGNWLGTTSQGYDVLAYLYGGLQVNFKAALIYLPAVYLLGITIGMMMGYLGGWFDLVLQRLIEIFSNMPFLFVVIIFSSMVPEQFKGLPVILTILVLFGWMGLTYLMRTAAYRDRERDYIAAARVAGAGTARILLRHLLPNSVAIIVTVIPFTMSGLVFALTSLDYLGFGLPPEHATWGRLLNDGLSNLSAPWLVTSAFTALVGLLVLITFIGEAVREAFDPKKHTYYR
jgi:microcin C transport system permease protein